MTQIDKLIISVYWSFVGGPTTLSYTTVGDMYKILREENYRPNDLQRKIYFFDRISYDMRIYAVSRDRTKYIYTVYYFTSHDTRLYVCSRRLYNIVIIIDSLSYTWYYLDIACKRLGYRLIFDGGGTKVAPLNPTTPIYIYEYSTL